MKEFDLPFKHIIIENFIDDKLSKKLISDLKKENLHLIENDLFKFYQTKDLNNAKSENIKCIISMLKNDIKKELEEKFKYKLANKLDVFGSLYSDTCYLICHDDRLENRAFAYVLYLNEMSVKDGGRLRLYHTDKNMVSVIAKEVIPKQGLLILFEVSEKSFHDVSEVIGSADRYTLTGWFHNDK